MEPVTLFSGIFLNICLYIIIYRKKKTNFLQSTKPMRYLLMAILLSDTWFLIDNLTSVNFMCQFISYLNYFLPIILEFSMMTADYILISLVMKSNDQKVKNVQLIKKILI
ncbi:hypothetical protein BpHYR1_028173 [Brachionus plicatilis]|uniref:Uncharacterized protein n=1 Tax=Brachionus plicatilis TaxID=10195 RepID=A0A3M7QHG0_BRAPC|nr:hypothetical protein BpHYR1_028173 [Brachionus plicatilis]